MNQGAMKEMLARIERRIADFEALPESEKRIASERLEGMRREDERRREESERERLLEEWRRRGISPRYFAAEWENWIADTPTQKLAFETVKREAWRKSLLLLGKPGTGKTHLAMCLAKDGAIYRRVPDLFRGVKEDFDSEGRTISELGDCGLLILDEIGRQKGSSFEANLLFEILDRRWCKSLPTTIVGNADENELHDLLGWAALDRLRPEIVRFDWGSKR